MAPKFTMVEYSCNFPCFKDNEIIIVDDSMEEEQIQEPKKLEIDGEDPLTQPIFRRSSSIGTFIFENKEALNVEVQDNISQHGGGKKDSPKQKSQDIS